jgi:hypothetical protein
METKTQVTTNAAELRGELAPLYRRHAREDKPQPAYIEIDPTERTMRAEYQPGDATPEGVWRNLVLRIDVSPNLTGDAIADLLEAPDVQSLATRICDGHSTGWDDGRRWGTLDADGQTANDELQRLLDNLTSYPDNLVSAYDACDWLQDYDWAEVAGMTDEQIDAEAARLAHEAEGESAIIDGGADAIARYLRTKRDE